MREHATAASSSGPRGILGLRNLVRLASLQLERLRSPAERHGDLVEMKVLGAPWFIESHPDDIERVLVKEARIMKRDKGFTSCGACWATVC